MRSLDGLIEFIAVVEAGSFRGGAAALNVSPAHVSRKVAELESRIGARLLQRTTRSVRVTEAGDLLRQRAGTVFGSLDEAFDEIGDRQATPRGLVRVAAGGAYGERMVAPALARFVNAHPDIRIDLDIADRRVDLVREGFDLAVRLGSLDDSSLVARKVAARRMILSASPAYLSSTPAINTVEDLAGHSRLGTTGAEWRLTSPEGDVRLKPSGLGVVWLAEFHLRDAIADGSLVQLLPDVGTEADPVWLVHASRAYLPARLRVVMDWLAHELG
jgi:DNA-binding transcriptional LysR family regulator